MNSVFLIMIDSRLSHAELNWTDLKRLAICLEPVQHLRSRWLWGRPHRCQRHHLRHMHPGPLPLNFDVTQTFSLYTNHNSIIYLSNSLHQSNSIYIYHTTITNYIHLSIPSHSILKFETEFYRVCSVGCRKKMFNVHAGALFRCQNR